LAQDAQKIGWRFDHLVGAIVRERLSLRSPLHLAGGDAEGGAPDPLVLVSDRISPTERLSESFGHGVPRQFLITGESEQRAPQPGAVLAVEALELVLRFGTHRRILHHIYIGSR